MVQWIEVDEGFLGSVIFSDEYVLHVSGEWMKLQDLGSENFRNAWNMLGAAQIEYSRFMVYICIYKPDAGELP